MEDEKNILDRKKLLRQLQDEEEEEKMLLEFQNQFFERNEKPSVKIIRKSNLTNPREKSRNSKAEPQKIEMKEQPMEIERDIIKLDIQISENSNIPTKIEPPKPRKTAFPSLDAFQPKRKFSSTNNESIQESPSKKPFSSVPYLSSVPEKIESPEAFNRIIESEKYSLLNLDKPTSNENEEKNLLSLNKKLSNLRFDFKGNILSQDEDLPTHMGLHHHANDPNAAGYTLVELVHLGKSVVPSQQALVLNILKEIGLKIQTNAYDSLGTPIFNYLMNQLSFPVFIRILSDNSSLTVLTSALHCLHSFFTSDLDDKLLDNISYHYKGNEFLPLDPYYLQEVDETEMTEFEITKIDLMRGLVKMNLFDRMEFLLDKFRNPEYVPLILNLLLRTCRHLHITKDLIKQTSLLQLIKNEFIIPSNFTLNNRPYSFPHKKAIQILNLLCAADENFLKDLLTEKFVSKLYLFFTQTLLPLLSENWNMEMVEIIVQILFLFRTILFRGLTDQIPSTELVEILLKLLTSNNPKINLLYIGIFGFLNMLTQFVHPMSKCWLKINEVFKLSPLLLENIILTNSQVKNNNVYFDQEGLNAISSILFFISSYIERISDIRDVNQFMQKVFSLLTTNVSNFLFNSIPETLMEFPIQTSSLKSNFPRFQTKNEQSVELRCQLNCLLAYIKLIFPKKHLQFSLLSESTLAPCWKLLQLLFHQQSIQLSKQDFLDEIIPFTSRYYLRVQSNLVFLLIQLFHSISQMQLTFSSFSSSWISSQYIRQAGVELVPYFLPKDRELAVYIISTYIFPSAEKKFQILLQFFQSILKRVSKDKDLFLMESENLPFPPHWIFLPVTLIYQTQIKKEKRKEMKLESLTSLICEFLEFILLLENNPFESSINLYSLGFKLLHILPIYLLEHELFFNSSISNYLNQLLTIYAKVDCVSSESDNIIWEGKLYALFSDMVTQFSSISFGEKVFAKYVFFFLRMDVHPKYRTLIFNELGEMLQTLNVEPPGDFKHYLYPSETDLDVLKVYRTLLSRGVLNEAKNKYIYWITIHHLSVYLFETSSPLSIFQKSLLQDILLFEDKDVVFHILEYDPSREIVFSSQRNLEKIPLKRIELVQSLCAEFDNSTQELLKEFEKLKISK